ncbi:MAG: Uncharacterised protein [Arcobacter lacus]|jgi:hypothetical protein|nr:MAG: Uncharacterised protein [Arcobacter lacus]
MDMRITLRKAIQSALIILKLVIPIYIIADILYFYNTLSYVSFLVEPITSLIGLPPETALAIISGMFLNLYAAVAFAAPLDMSIHQWSILAVFLGVCHALVVESVIMKKIGIPNIYSYSLRVAVGLFLGYLTYKIPSSWFEASLSDQVFKKVTHDNFSDMIYNSITSAVTLSVQIIILILILIFIMDYIKTRKFVINSKKNVSKNFSIVTGVFLGITYGAGILIDEARSGNISKDDLFYIGTFLMICHAIIEDTLLFVIFGADFTMVILIRTLAAIIISWIALKIYKKLYTI